MKKIIPNINFNNCREALEYYKTIFGGEVKNLQESDNTPGFEGQEGKIVHVELHINNECILYLVDIFSERAESGNMDLILELESEEEINKLYEALSKDGTIKFELQKTFWGAYHAIVTDRFGVTWGLNYMLH
ncbi:MAG TPA: VOC family protein [Clostridiales bacterium]|nr:MAG: glyoxalase [Clostridiales bacterium GWD2_32_59]HAN09771.1 VOC family protein [Clostridiales bacterium]